MKKFKNGFTFFNFLWGFFFFLTFQLSVFEGSIFWNNPAGENPKTCREQEKSESFLTENFSVVVLYFGECEEKEKSEQSEKDKNNLYKCYRKE